LCEYLNNFQPDILVSDFAEWKSDKNKIKRKKVILSNKSKFYTINKKNIHKFKTPYSFPLGKFYKNEIFYKLADLKENVYFQDVKLYYLCLNCSITYGYINKVIGLHRSDRDDSSTNIAWSKAKVDMWIDTIKTLSTHDVLLNGIFYLTVKGFKKAYLKYYSSRFNVNGKILMCYLPKVLYPLVICFVWFLLIKFRKIIKVSNKK
jgi:hypothetical protein